MAVKRVICCTTYSCRCAAVDKISTDTARRAVRLNAALVELLVNKYQLSLTDARDNNTIRYDTRCYSNVRSKANMSQLNLPHGNDN